MKKFTCILIPLLLTIVFYGCSYNGLNNKLSNSSTNYLSSSSKEQSEINSSTMNSSETQEQSMTSSSTNFDESYSYYEHPDMAISKITPEKLTFRDRAMGETTIIDNPEDISEIINLVDKIKITTIEADKSDYEYEKPLYSIGYYEKKDDAEPIYTVNLSPVSVDMGSTKGKAYKSINFSGIGEQLLKAIASAENKKG